jgi:hypothetical protein
LVLIVCGMSAHSFENQMLAGVRAGCLRPA